MADNPSARQPSGATRIAALADGTLFWGQGVGAEGEAVGELCFNTAMAGLSGSDDGPQLRRADHQFHLPPHRQRRQCRGCGGHPTRTRWAAAMAEPITSPSNFRSSRAFRPVAGRLGPDRPRRRRHPRHHPPHPPAWRRLAVIAHRKDGQFDIPALIAKAKRGAASRTSTSPNKSPPPKAGRGMKARGSWARAICPATCRPTPRTSSP